MSGKRGKNLGQLVSAPSVVFDTTIPRYMAKHGCESLLADLFGARATIPVAVDLELKGGRHKIKAINNIVGARGFMKIVALDDDQERRARTLRSLLPQKKYPPNDAENLGEAQAIILAQDSGLPLVIEDWDGAENAIARKVEVFGSVHIFMVAALTGRSSDAEAWGTYRDLIDLSGLGVPARSGWDSSAASEKRFMAHLQAIRAALRRRRT